MKMQGTTLARALLRGSAIILGVAGCTNLSAQSLSAGSAVRAGEAGRKNDRLPVRNAGKGRIASRLPTRIDTRLSTRLDGRYHADSSILKPLEQSKAAIKAATAPR